MEGIIVTDEELKRLEKRLGPDVRQMGPWNSDGIFGYAIVPILAIDKAAAALGDPNLDSALLRLRNMTERTQPFVELLEMFGPVLIQQIIFAYRECSFEVITGIRPVAKPPERHSRAVVPAAA